MTPRLSAWTRLASIACSTSGLASTLLTSKAISSELDLFDFQNIVDQPDKPLTVLMRDGEQAHGGFRQLPAGAAGKQAEGSGNQRQGRA